MIAGLESAQPGVPCYSSCCKTSQRKESQEKDNLLVKTIVLLRIQL